MGHIEVVIAQQGADSGNPIGWLFILSALVCLGLLAREVRNAFSPTPAWDDDRSGLRRATAGFLGGRRALALAVLLLLLAVGVGSAVGGGVKEEGPATSGIPSNWAGLEPLLPLAPSLKDIAALKGIAAGGPSRVLAAESGGGGALRVRALPEGGGAARRGGGARVATERTPSGRPRRAAMRVPSVVRERSVRRILATRVVTALGVTNDLREIVVNDLRNLPGLPIDIDVDIDIPRIDPDRPSTRPIGRNPLPGGVSVPGIPGLRAPINLTVVDSQADSRFDVLLVASGRHLLEGYRFRDRDIAGLAAQINLRSSVLVADVLKDGKPLARVSAAPLRSADAAGPGSGSGAAGLARGASRGEGGIGAGQATLGSDGSGTKGRPSARSRRTDRRSGGRSAAGGRSSRSFTPESSSSSGSGTSTPRRATPSRRSTTPRRLAPARPRRSSPRPEPKPRRGGGHSKPSRLRGGRGSSGGRSRDRGDN